MIHAVDAASFAANPGYAAESLRDFTEEHLEAHDFDPGLSRVADLGGEVVGFLLARGVAGRGGRIRGSRCRRSDHQGRGVGTALLADAFAAFAWAGLRQAQLGVDSDNPRARCCGSMNGPGCA